MNPANLAPDGRRRFGAGRSDILAIILILAALIFAGLAIFKVTLGSLDGSQEVGIAVVAVVAAMVL